MSPQDWLPLEAGLRPEVKSRLAAAIDEWRKLWFVRNTLAMSVMRTARSGASDSGDNAPWKIYGRHVAISLSRSHARTLLDWVLDSGIEYLTESDLDQKVLDALADDLLRELGCAIEKALGLDPLERTSPSTPSEPFDRRGGIVFGLMSTQGDRLASVAIPLAALTPLLRSLLPPAREFAPVSSRAEAVKSTALRFDVNLGAVELPIGELATLAVGDVLVLNRQLDQPAEFVMRGANTIALHGLLDLSQEQTTLVVHPSET